MEGQINELVAAARSGDGDSFFAVFSHYRGRLEIKIKTELEQEHHCMVDDILQLTYTRAFEKLDRYNPERDFYPWLASVCQNIIREQLRARARGANSYLEDLTEAVEPQDGEPRKYGTGITTAFKGRSSRPPMPDVAAAKERHAESFGAQSTSCRKKIGGFGA
jgi:RNA polymerase sigma factor (sigma-70 family)